jgi:hypothetical protein
MALQFTAARARNSGFRHLRSAKPELDYVQFIDGDCELVESWPGAAIAFLESRSDVAVVAGHLHERYPTRTVYNWLCQQEWKRPVGEVRATGGIMMVRAGALSQVGGFREALIAGEEPELCVRLRAAGWRIWHLDSDMALHDANMTRFAQWWRRAQRSGYAFAEGAHMHGAPPERHWVWEARRARIWGLYLPSACIVTGLVLGPLGWMADLRSVSAAIHPPDLPQPGPS